jgi:CRP/FNR family transcriptional regulator
MAQICSECGVRDRALCASLTDAELAVVVPLGQHRRLARGDVLLHVGDAPMVCANVQSGVLKIGNVTRSGDEAIVGLLYPGDFIGQPFAGNHEFDVVALTEVDLCVFPRASFERVLGDHRNMEKLLLSRTLDELTRTRGWLARMARATAAEKVAGFLDDMARRMTPADCRRGDGVTIGAVFDLPLSRSEIADLLGLTIETVSRQMTRLRAVGIIDLPGGRGIIVMDPAALAAATEGG